MRFEKAVTRLWRRRLLAVAMLALALVVMVR